MWVRRFLLSSEMMPFVKMFQILLDPGAFATPKLLKITSHLHHQYVNVDSQLSNC